MKGKVLQPNGKLASNAVIYLKERKSKPNYSSHLRVVSGIVLGHENLQTIKCDAIGKFDIPKMDDVYACYISHSSGYAKLMDAEIYDGEAIKLIPWSKVEGQVLHYGKPAAGVVVSLKNLTGIGWEESRFPYISFSETQLTDGNGKYQFKKCFAGIWDQDFLVPASENKSNDGYSVSKQISLVAGKTQIQNLGSSQSQLKGRVLFPDSFKPNLERSSVILSYHETICYTDDESDSPSSSCRPLSTQYISKLQKDGSFHVVDLGAEPRYLHIYVTDRQGIYDRSYKRYSLTKKITNEMLSKVKEGQALDLGELKLTRDLNFR